MSQDLSRVMSPTRAIFRPKACPRPISSRRSMLTYAGSGGRGRNRKRAGRFTCGLIASPTAGGVYGPPYCLGPGFAPARGLSRSDAPSVPRGETTR
jgi:hypothetical protein